MAGMAQKGTLRKLECRSAFPGRFSSLADLGTHSGADSFGRTLSAVNSTKRAVTLCIEKPSPQPHRGPFRLPGYNLLLHEDLRPKALASPINTRTGTTTLGKSNQVRVFKIP